MVLGVFRSGISAINLQEMAFLQLKFLSSITSITPSITLLSLYNYLIIQLLTVLVIEVIEENENLQNVRVRTRARKTVGVMYSRKAL